MAKVFVMARKARPFWFGHPWVFSGAIDRVRGKVKDGEVVELCDHEGKLIGQGFFNEKSQIRVRLAAMGFEGPLDEKLMLARLDAAVALRRDVLRLEEASNSYRVVHSEGDGLPGLVVDKIGPHLVLQVSALGMATFVPKLVERLVELFKPESVVERTSRIGLEEEGLERRDGVLYGQLPTEPVVVVENGVKFFVDVVAGQKTGWYCDQRDNRAFVASLAKGKDVLDAFSYVGGFGLPAAVAGAKSVRCIDSSGFALQFAQRGAAQNGVADRMTFDEANVLRALDYDAREGRKYDIVIVDPPKLVHRRIDLEKGLRLYEEIQQKAIAVTRDDGIIVTCSCSQHVQEDAFEEVIAGAAKDSYVRLQLIYRGGQGGDHPLTLPHSESRYLKLHVYRVRRPAAELVAAYIAASTPFLRSVGSRSGDEDGGAADADVAAELPESVSVDQGEVEIVEASVETLPGADVDPAELAVDDAVEKNDEDEADDDLDDAADSDGDGDEAAIQEWMATEGDAAKPAAPITRESKPYAGHGAAAARQEDDQRPAREFRERPPAARDGGPPREDRGFGGFRGGSGDRGDRGFGGDRGGFRGPPSGGFNRPERGGFGGERRPFGGPPQGGGFQRPDRNEGGERRPFGGPPSGGGFNRPERGGFGGERRPFSGPPQGGGFQRPDRNEGGERRPFSGPPSGGDFGRPPREGGFDRPAEGGFDRPPRENVRFNTPPFRPGQNRPAASSGGFDRPRREEGGEGRPFSGPPTGGGFQRPDRSEGGERRPFGGPPSGGGFNRPDRGGFGGERRPFGGPPQGGGFQRPERGGFDRPASGGPPGNTEGFRGPPKPPRRPTDGPTEPRGEGPAGWGSPSGDW